MIEEISGQPGVRVVTRSWSDIEVKGLRDLGLQVVNASPRTIVLFAASGVEPALVFARSSDLDLDMRELISLAAPLIDGRGGGSPQVAQAGGRHREGLKQALDIAQKSIDQSEKTS